MIQKDTFARWRLLAGVLCCALVGAMGCDGGVEEEVIAPRVLPDPVLIAAPESAEPIQPVRGYENLDKKIVELGGKLFYDTRLSADGLVSCATCHDISNGGDSGVAVQPGTYGVRGGLNAPTVLNSALNPQLFWDGRVETLEEVIDAHITERSQLGNTWEKILEAIGEDEDYPDEFLESFPDGITEQNVKVAIATFERSLITTGSRFDAFLEGNDKALSREERMGYEIFKSSGCVACHQGRNVGGNMFQRFGIVGSYLKDRGKLTKADEGRYNTTGKRADRFVFRVPSLRNVAHTSPYFHDGSAKTLQKAVRAMSKYQTGREFSDKEVRRVVAFLKTLDGDVPDVRPFERAAQQKQQK